MKLPFAAIVAIAGIGVVGAAPASASAHAPRVSTPCPVGTLPATITINSARNGYSAPAGPGRHLLTSFNVTGPIAPFDPSGVMQVAQARTTPVTTIYKTYTTTTHQDEDGTVYTNVDASAYPGTQSYMESAYQTMPSLPPATGYQFIIDKVKVCVGLGGIGEQEEPDFTFNP